MSAKHRAAEVLSRLPQGTVIGVEVGVLRGAMSAELLRRLELRLFMVDNWKGKEEWPSGYRPSDMPACKKQTDETTLFADGRRGILEMDSVLAAYYFRDAALDFVLAIWELPYPKLFAHWCIEEIAQNSVQLAVIGKR